MTNNSKKDNFKQILLEFDKKCKSKNIWYSLGDLTLLSAKTKKDFYLSKNYLNVFMTWESFNSFISHFPNCVLDSLTISNYCYLNPLYFEKDLDVFIQINILVPSLIKKTEDFYNVKNIIRQNLSYFLTYGGNNNFSNFWLNIYYKFINLFYTPLVWKEIYANIADEQKYNGYFIINSFRENINKHWIPTLTFQMQELELFDHNFPVFIEYETYLEKKFGNYMENEIKIKKSKTIDLNKVQKFIID